MLEALDERYATMNEATSRGYELRRIYELVDCWYDKGWPDRPWAVTAKIPKREE